MSFERAFTETIGFEGEYIDDPDDPGGETKYGISRRSYPDLDIANLTIKKARQIYQKDYWNKMRLGEVTDEDIAVKLFDMGVNLGVKVASKILQKSLNAMGSVLVVDGIIGPKTLRQLRNVASLNPDGLMSVLRTQQSARYLQLIADNPKLAKFARGWFRRSMA